MDKTIPNPNNLLHPYLDVAGTSFNKFVIGCVVIIVISWEGSFKCMVDIVKCVNHTNYNIYYSYTRYFCWAINKNKIFMDKSTYIMSKTQNSNNLQLHSQSNTPWQFTTSSKQWSPPPSPPPPLPPASLRAVANASPVSGQVFYQNEAHDQILANELGSEKCRVEDRRCDL